MSHHYILIDANNVAFQCQSAAMTRGSRSKRLYAGEVETTAVNGVLAVVRDLRVKHPKARLLMLWDTGKVWRYKEYPEYKGNRKEKSDLVAVKDALKAQKALIFKVCDSIGIPQVTAENYEADDIAAFMADMLAKAGHQVTLITRDQDWLQMVRPGVRWHDRFKDRTVSALSFHADVGFPSPDHFTESKIFKGDAGDNVFGIKGVGDVAAEHLVAEFGTPEKLIDGWKDWVLDGGLENKHPLNRHVKAIETFLADPDKARAHMAMNRKLMDLRTMYGNRDLAQAIRKSPGAINEEMLKALLSKLAFTSVVTNLPVWLQPFKNQELK